jgi:hypothetical protein
MPYSVLFLLFAMSSGFAVLASWLLARRRKERFLTLFGPAFFVVLTLLELQYAAQAKSSFDIAHEVIENTCLSLVLIIGLPVWCFFEIVLWWRSFRQRTEPPPATK